MRYTKHFLKKIEEVFSQSGFKIRYEKGLFNSGYCIVEDQNIIVVNRFYDTEARINVLLDILNKVDFDENKIVDQNKEFYLQMVAKAEKIA